MSTDLPADLGDAGAALWRAVMADYTLEEHESLLLLEACRTADLCATLARLVGSEPMAAGRIRPEVIELRQQRILLARLLVALRVPIGAEQSEHAAPRLQRRGARGVYAVRGAS